LWGEDTDFKACGAGWFGELFVPAGTGWGCTVKCGKDEGLGYGIVVQVEVINGKKSTGSVGARLV